MRQLTFAAIPLAGLAVDRVFGVRRMRTVAVAVLVTQVVVVVASAWPAMKDTWSPEARQAIWFRGSTGRQEPVERLLKLMPDAGRLLFSPAVDHEIRELARLREGFGLNALAYRGVTVVNGWFKGISTNTVSPDERLFYGRIRAPQALVESDEGLDVLGVRYVLANADEPWWRFTRRTGCSSFAAARNPMSYLLGWMVAFGPVLFVVLFDWRTTVEFSLAPQGNSRLCARSGRDRVAGSLESERHALNWASPVVYVMLGRTIERHGAWFRSRPLAALLLATQALVHRVFLETPQPDAADADSLPTMLLTPMGDGAGYLHLFPDYISPQLAWIQFWQYAVLGTAIFVWLRRRAYLRLPDTRMGNSKERAV